MPPKCELSMIDAVTTFKDMPPPKSALDVVDAYNAKACERAAKEEKERRRVNAIFERCIVTLARDCGKLLDADLEKPQSADMLARIEVAYTLKQFDKRDVVSALKLMLDARYELIGYIVSVDGYDDMTGNFIVVILYRNQPSISSMCVLI